MVPIPCPGRVQCEWDITPGTVLDLLMHYPSKEFHKQIKKSSNSGTAAYNIMLISYSTAYYELTWEASYGTVINMILHTVFPMFVDFEICFLEPMEFCVHCPFHSVAKPLATADPQTIINIKSNWFDRTKQTKCLGNLELRTQCSSFVTCGSLIFFQPQ